MLTSRLARHGTRDRVGQNDAVPASTTTPSRRGQPSRLQSAVFQPIGDAGRAALVERRIAEAITGGVLAPGTKLPAESELAKLFGVAPVTARESLQSLRDRRLVVTRRGRNGGSFVVETANAAEFGTRALRDMSRVALRDLAAHYLAVTGACVALAAQRADPTEIMHIRSRLDRFTGNDPLVWRRLADDAHLEISALSQSARLTREQMRLQAEFSPFLALVDASETDRDRSRSQLLALLDAVSEADSAAATSLVRESITEAVDRLIDRQAELAGS